MSQSRHKLVSVQFRGLARTVLCHRSTPGSALVAVYNYKALQVDKAVTTLDPVNPYVDEETLKEGLLRVLMQAKNLTFTQHQASNQFFMEKLGLFATATRLNPANHSSHMFAQCEILDMFAALEIRAVHGWLLDPSDRALDPIRKTGYDNAVLLADKIMSQKDKAAGVSSTDYNQWARIKSFLDASSHHLTSHGEQMKEGQLKVLYFKNQFNIVHKYNGDLFILETDEHILSSVDSAMWKRLTVVETDSFYVTSRFSPVKRQPNAQKAQEWWDMKLSQFDEPVDVVSKTKSKKRMKGRNLAKELQEEEKTRDCLKDDNDSSTSCAPEKLVVDSPPNLGILEEERPGKETVDSPPSCSGILEATTSLTDADKFAIFLELFVDESSSLEIPHFRGVASGMNFAGETKFYVPYKLIKQHDRNLAINIQNQYPSIHEELLQKTVKFLVCEGFDAKHAAEHVQLEILGLPEPMSTQTFSQFVAANAVVYQCILYGGEEDLATTPDGRDMALGYLTQMLDTFEAGKCWGEGECAWDINHLEVRNHGKEFFINKKADMDLTWNLLVFNLLRYCEIILAPFSGKGKRYPAFFDSFQNDCLHAPDPKGDQQIWQRFLTFMRSPLALKAPLVRSGLICNFYRTLSSQSDSSGFILLSHQRPSNDWRDLVRHTALFLQVYNYKNNISLYYGHDKWDASLWDVLKFTRHFTEHVLYYLMRKHLHQDIDLVELTIARRLERHIADVIRKIVLDYGVNGILSSPWSCFKLSDCKTMPLLLSSQGEHAVLANVLKESGDKAKLIPEDILVVHIPARKSCEEETVWAYMEVGRICKPSSVKSMHRGDISMDECKQFLEKQGFNVTHLGDISLPEDYVEVSKFAKEAWSNRDDPDISLQGPLCEDFYTISGHVQSWLSQGTST